MTPAESNDANRPDSLPRQSVQISQRERDAGALSPTNRALAVLILSCRGYVILTDAVRQELIASLRRELSLIHLSKKPSL